MAAKQKQFSVDSPYDHHDKQQGSLLNRLVIEIEEQLTNCNTRLTPERKGLLIDILYERFKEIDRIDISQINHMISVLADKPYYSG